MLASVNETFVSSEKTDTKELHEQNCAPIAGTSGVTAVTFDTTIATWDSIVAIVARMCAICTAIDVEHVTTKSVSAEK
jgi:hypothetical protein